MFLFSSTDDEPVFYPDLREEDDSEDERKEDGVGQGEGKYDLVSISIRSLSTCICTKRLNITLRNCCMIYTGSIVL